MLLLMSGVTPNLFKLVKLLLHIPHASCYTLELLVSPHLHEELTSAIFWPRHHKNLSNLLDYYGSKMAPWVEGLACQTVKLCEGTGMGTATIPWLRATAYNLYIYMYISIHIYMYIHSQAYLTPALCSCSLFWATVHFSTLCSAPQNEHTAHTETHSELNGEAMIMRYSTIYS